MGKDIYRSYQSYKNNEDGKMFEEFISKGCEIYAETKRAIIEKTPEPFTLKSKNSSGTATVYFKKKAQPDFKGVLAGGRCIVFEAKHTSTNKLRADVVTENQAKVLSQYNEMGAVAGVVGCIEYVVFFMPWDMWEHMKIHFGRNYLTAEDVKPYRVRFTGATLFLDFANGEMVEENF